MIWLILLVSLFIVFGFVAFIGAPYVPSQRKYVARVFDSLYKLGKKDVLVDVGSGDGLVLRIAARKGATAIGYEINPVLVGISKLLSRSDKKVSIHLANFWLTKLPAETTIVYAFSVSRDLPKLTRKLQTESSRLQKPLKLLIFGHHLSDRKPDGTFEAYHLYTFRPLQAEKAQV